MLSILKKLTVVFLIMTTMLLMTACSESIEDEEAQVIEGEEFEAELRPESEERGVPSPLTGMRVAEKTLERKPLAITVENSISARPQSGLDKADLVYEFLAEGGITRLIAIYLHNDVKQIGPVRSARPYFVVPSLEYDALYAHCGGSQEALEAIRQLRVDDLDEFRVGRQAFWRIKDRKAPHNLYTATDKLRLYAKEQDLEGQSSIRPFLFLKRGQKNAGGQEAKEVLIKYYGRSHKVSYSYDDGSNSYLRYNSGVAHIDKTTKKQLRADNVLVQFVDTVTREDTTLAMDLVGKGKALFFNNGRVYRGSWQKESLREPTIFLMDNGQEFKLVPGQTWIQVVPTNLSVEY